jgi:hypothetical protein
MDTAILAARKLLSAVHELHQRGFTDLRASMGLAPSGMYWRCSLDSASNPDADYHYSSRQGFAYFNKENLENDTPAQLADKLQKNLHLVSKTFTANNAAYVEWFSQMLEMTAPDCAPIQFADYELPKTHLTTVGGERKIEIPLPPGR